MVVISRFVKFFWFLSLLLFFLMLFAAYYYWPQIVDIKLNKHIYSSEDIYITKEHAFYYVVGFIGLINIIMTTLSTTLSKLPSSLIIVPNKQFWTSSAEKIDVARALLKNWALLFLGLINMLSSLFVFALLVINYQDQTTATRNFDWLLPFILGVLLISFFYPLFRFSVKKHAAYSNGYFSS